MTGNSIFGRIWGKSDMFIARYQPFQGKRAWWRVLAGYGCTAEATGVVVTSSELIVSGIYKGALPTISHLVKSSYSQFEFNAD